MAGHLHFRSLPLLALTACQPASPPADPANAAIITVVPPAEDTNPPAVEPEPPPSPDPHELVALLGKPFEDPVVQGFLRARNAQIRTSSYPDGATYYTDKDLGFSLLEEDGAVGTVFLYSEGLEDHRQYTGSLPRGLHFGDTRARVLERLGEPDKSGGGMGSHTAIGPVSAWDKYFAPGWSLHVQYGRDGGIELVTLMTVRDDPDR